MASCEIVLGVSVSLVLSVHHIKMVVSWNRDMKLSGKQSLAPVMKMSGQQVNAKSPNEISSEREPSEVKVSRRHLKSSDSGVFEAARTGKRLRKLPARRCVAAMVLLCIYCGRGAIGTTAASMLPVPRRSKILREWRR